MEFFQYLWRDITEIFSTIEFVDYVDILVVAFFVYQLIIIVRDTRTSQLVKSIIFLFVASFIAGEVGLKTFGYVLDEVLQFGVLALFVVFQPEIRRAIEQMGRTNIFKGGIFARRDMDELLRARWRNAIAHVCDAVQQFSDKKVGSIIVFERASNLYDYRRRGTVLEAEVSTELLLNIFYNKAPLHDGAVIISEAKIASAGCVLPLSSNVDINKDLGTRHRAALGTAESTDALVVVVSEETGIVSVAKNGVLVRRIDRASLYRMLDDEIIPKKEHNERFPRFFKKKEEVNK